MAYQCQGCNTSNKDGSRYCKQCGVGLLKGGRYHFVSLLGEGGMGVVYQARDTQNNNRLVAVKKLGLPQGVTSCEAERLFQVEAQILSGLYHPNIVNVEGVFQEQGSWYLAMSFVPGETLEVLLNRTPGQGLPVPQALNIGKQLSDAFSYLHTWQNQQRQLQPIIFRDLKPANVMVNSDGHVVLIDFGIARLFKQGQSKDTMAYGSPGYAPPEQFGRNQTSPQSDLYALGRLLHCLLTGDDPGDRGMQDPGRPVFDPQHPISANLDLLLRRMQSMQVGDRPKTAQEVGNVLSYVLAHWNDVPASIMGNRAGAQTASVGPLMKNQAIAAAPVNPSQSLVSPFPAHVTIFSVFDEKDSTHVMNIKSGLEGALWERTNITFRDTSLISAGSDHVDYMNDAATTSDLILLFVSNDFLASKSCSMMTNLALQRHQRGEATVVPIVVRPCMYDCSSLSDLPLTPMDGCKVKPITQWRDRDAAEVTVVKAIMHLLTDLHAQGYL